MSHPHVHYAGRYGEKSETADPRVGGTIRGIIGLLETAGKAHEERGDLIADENSKKYPKDKPQHVVFLHPLTSQVPTRLGYQTLPGDVNCVFLTPPQFAGEKHARGRYSGQTTPSDMFRV